ncbi:MAG: GNAT family N-acetyltransferase [Rhizobiaceae bacterium]|nr:GNAT family N-acetyltransferase [Rhizobiaceae bacterium]
MKVRPGRPADLDRLVEIEAGSFDPKFYTPMTRRQFRHHLGSPNSVMLVVADPADQVLGYALGLLHARRNALRFYSLAVAPDAQRGELGRMLFEAMEEAGFSRGLDMQCEVRSDNVKLITRYESLGYRRYSTVANYYPDGQSCIKFLRVRK